MTDDIYLEDAAGFLVADFAPEGVFGPGHTAAAHLAAAAPDLADALENLIIAIGMGWDLAGVLEVAQAALIKAGTARQNGTNPGRHTVPSIQTEEVKL